MADTPEAPQNTAPQTPQPAAPPPPPDALQQYRIEQLEKALEQLQAKQDALEGATTQRLDDSLNHQANMYGSYANYLTFGVGLLSLMVAAIGLWGIRNLKKAAHKKLDDWVKDKSSGYEKKFDDLYTQLNEQSVRQIEQSKEIEAIKFYEEGRHNQLQRNYGEAHRFFSKAIELNPNYYEAHTQRAIINVGLRKFQDALSDIENALELNPKHSHAHFYKALIYKFLNRSTEEVISALEAAIKLNENYMNILKEDSKPTDNFYYLRNDPRFKKLVGLE